ncbi:MAG: sulfotransferase [Pseudomonadales bacterium]|nr:sulfotransferase [Pseudomonadales bacterium]
MKPVNLHVVGCPRSGTTLMAEMLVACYPHQQHSEHEETLFKVPPHEKGLRLSKKPNDALWMAPLLKRDENLYVIAMLRDPRSVICSQHKAWPGMYFCNYPVWKRAEKAIQTIQAHPRVLLVRYEDLVRDPMAVQADIEQQFPFLERAHDFNRFHEVAQSGEEARNALGGVRAVDLSRIAGWQEHLPRLKQQLERYPQLADDLITHGYETDRSWLKSLDGVEAETFPCRYSDSSEFWKHLEQKLRFVGKRRRYFRARGL